MERKAENKGSINFKFLFHISGVRLSPDQCFFASVPCNRKTLLVAPGETYKNVAYRQILREKQNTKERLTLNSYSTFMASDKSRSVFQQDFARGSG